MKLSSCNISQSAWDYNEPCYTITLEGYPSMDEAAFLRNLMMDGSISEVNLNEAFKNARLRQVIEQNKKYMDDILQRQQKHFDEYLEKRRNNMDERMMEQEHPEYIKRIYVDEAKRTIAVKFRDGSVQKVKCHEDDEFDINIGVAMCIALRQFESKQAFLNCVKKKTRFMKH